MVENRQMWDTHWGKGAFHTLEHRALINACKSIFKGNVSNSHILEIGSGRGVDSVKLAQLGAKVYLLDYSLTSFSISLGLAQEAGVEVSPVIADAGMIPFSDEKFDLVFSQGVLEHQENIPLLQEQSRVTKKGGYVIIDVPQLYSVQALVKAAQIHLGVWPYGKEESFSLKRVNRMLSHCGLEPVGAYGWELLPTLHLGFRGLLQSLSKKTKGDSCPLIKGDNGKESWIEKFEQSKLAPFVLNNIGVIGKK